MADKFVKPIREVGMVVSKTINEAREAGKSFDGSRTWDARPEEYVLNVISCDEDDFNKDKGFVNYTIADYKVSRDIFDSVHFGSWGKVKFTASEYDGKIRIKAESFVPIEKK